MSIIKVSTSDPRYPVVSFGRGASSTELREVLDRLTSDKKVSSITIETHHNDNKKILEAIQEKHFTLEEEEFHYELAFDDLPDDEPAVPKDIVFKDFNQCGLKPFAEVARNVSALRGLKTEDGLRALQGNYFKPHLWQVAFKGSQPVGVLLCEVRDDLGAMHFVATIDNEQGNGLGTLLHRRALLLLKRNGARIYRATIASTNKPMFKVFERNFCRHVSTDRVFTWTR